MAAIDDFLSRLERQLASGNAAVEVGFMAGATYPIDEDGETVYVADVAIENEFGDRKKKQVARPFFRRMIAKESKHWSTDIKGLLRLYPVDKALDLLGRRMGEDLQMSIRDFVDPPLRPYTIAKKGFAKPLIDTGHMMNSVTHRVVK